MVIWKNFVNLFQNDGGDKQVLWEEMSYRTYVQDSNNPEPEVWDEIYEPQEYEWIGWILE